MSPSNTKQLTEGNQLALATNGRGKTLDGWILLRDVF
jgi:hypothetical protein